MSMYYDKNGSPLELMEWAGKFEDHEYRRVAQTVTPDGYKVSTIWLGIDHNWGMGEPLIFETMVFAPITTEVDLMGRKMDYHPSLESYSRRYTTLKEAEAGHAEAVARLAKEAAK